MRNKIFNLNKLEFQGALFCGFFLFSGYNFQNFGLSYAKTLQEWQSNIGDWKGLDNYDTRFRKMWNLYLNLCIVLFKLKKMFLYQFVFTKKTNLGENLHHIRKC